MTYESDLNELKNILSTLEKNPYRKFRAKTLIQKRENAKECFNRLENFLLINEKDFESEELNLIIKNSRHIFYKINEYTKQKLDNTRQKRVSFKTAGFLIIFFNSIRTKPKMVFDEKRAAQIIPTYDGGPEKLEDFISSIEYIDDKTDEAEKANLLAFLKIRIQGNAKRTLPKTVASIKEVTDHLRQMFGIPETPSSMLKKLSTLKQTEGLDNFCEKLQQITQELENCYIDRKIPAIEAKKMALDAAVDASRQNIKNKDLRQILKAGNFTSLKDLTNKIEENKDLEKEDPTPQANVFQFNNGRNNRGRNNWRPNNRPPWSHQEYQNTHQNYWSTKPNWNQNRQSNTYQRNRGFQNSRDFQNPRDFQNSRDFRNSRGFQNSRGRGNRYNRNIYNIEELPQDSDIEIPPQAEQDQQYQYPQSSSQPLGFIPGQFTQ